MKVLIIDQLDQYILELSLMITRSLGIVTLLESNKEKIENIINGNSADLIIFNESLFPKDDVLNLYKKIGNKKVISRNASDFNELFLKLNIEGNLELISSLIDNSNPKFSGNFISVTTNKLLSIHPHNLGCDLYIKLLKNGKDHYVKRLHASDQFSHEEIKKYLNMGLKEFYIPEEQFENFINILTMELIKTFQAEKTVPLDLIQLHNATFEVICERINLFNIDDLGRNLIDEYVKSVATSIKLEGELNRFLNHLKSEKLNYAFSHCYLTALISYQMAIHNEWQSESTKDTLLYLSLFHDLSLLDSDLSKVNHTKDLENLDEVTKKKVLNHANDSAELVSKINNVPFGMTQLIREHHGVKDGDGFPESLSMNISPLVMTFIVLENFSGALIDAYTRNHQNDEANLKTEMRKVLKVIQISYQKLVYQKTALELGELLSKLNLI